MTNGLVVISFTFCCIFYLLLSIKLVRLHSDVKKILAALHYFFLVNRSSGSSDPTEEVSGDG